MLASRSRRVADSGASTSFPDEIAFAYRSLNILEDFSPFIWVVFKIVLRFPVDVDRARSQPTVRRFSSGTGAMREEVMF